MIRVGAFYGDIQLFSRPAVGTITPNEVLGFDYFDLRLSVTSLGLIIPVIGKQIVTFQFIASNSRARLALIARHIRSFLSLIADLDRDGV